MESVNTKIVVNELHRAFKLFNDNLFGGSLPLPAILIQSRGNKKLTLGWCTVNQVWKNELTKEEKYEINLVAEGLNRGIYPVMSTLLHEMVHLHNLVNNIKDTSRGFTYHNMKFKKVAEAHGLEIEHGEKVGWSISRLAPSTMDLVDSADFNETVFSFGRMDFTGDEEKKKKKTSSRKYQCPECGNSIRASKDLLALCGCCTDVAAGKIVPFIRVMEEGDEEEEEVYMSCNDCGYNWKSWGEIPTVCPDCDSTDIEQVEGAEPEEELQSKDIDIVCNDCGVMFTDKEGKGSYSCHDCGSNDCVELSQMPKETPSPASTTLPDGIIEVDTMLGDGEGHLIPVKQGAFDVDSIMGGEHIEEPAEEAIEAHNTGWTVERVMEVLKAVRDEAEGLGLEKVEFDDIHIEINEKMVSQWASYKEGKKISFSKEYLTKASDSEIIDTIKHEYVHHYQWKVGGLKVNHKKEFKALCKYLLINTEVPTKNNRAMK